MRPGAQTRRDGRRIFDGENVLHVGISQRFQVIVAQTPASTVNPSSQRGIKRGVQHLGVTCCPVSPFHAEVRAVSHTPRGGWSTREPGRLADREASPLVELHRTAI